MAEQKTFNASKYFYQKHEIILNCGRTIWLQNLKQRQTYSGVYEGVPWGRARMARWPEMFREYAEEDYDCRAIIVDARDFPLPVPEEELEGYRWPIPQGRPGAREYEPVSLGPITCVARFEAYDPVRNEPETDFSQLVMVWFQADFAMPIDPVVLEKIKAIDWEREAVNGSL